MWYAFRKRDLIRMLAKSLASGAYELRYVALGLAAAGGVAWLLRR